MPLVLPRRRPRLPPCSRCRRTRRPPPGLEKAGLDRQHAPSRSVPGGAGRSSKCPQRETSVPVVRSGHCGGRVSQECPIGRTNYRLPWLGVGEIPVMTIPFEGRHSGLECNSAPATSRLASCKCLWTIHQAGVGRGPPRATDRVHGATAGSLLVHLDITRPAWDSRFDGAGALAPAGWSSIGVLGEAQHHACGGSGRSWWLRL